MPFWHPKAPTDTDVFTDTHVIELKTVKQANRAKGTAKGTGGSTWLAGCHPRLQETLSLRNKGRTT